MWSVCTNSWLCSWVEARVLIHWSLCAYQLKLDMCRSIKIYLICTLPPPQAMRVTWLRSWLPLDHSATKLQVHLKTHHCFSHGSVVVLFSWAQFDNYACAKHICTPSVRSMHSSVIEFSDRAMASISDQRMQACWQELCCLQTACKTVVCAYSALRKVQLRYAMPCHAMLHLCWAAVCCTVLCRDMLRYVVLCYVALHCALQFCRAFSWSVLLHAVADCWAPLYWHALTLLFYARNSHSCTVGGEMHRKSYILASEALLMRYGPSLMKGSF